jgi:hypothetical protein
MAKNQNFFIGRKFDPESNKVSMENIYYDPADLTTHMFVTGMTGSGKTGLCISLMEEAALHKIPAIVIDPKGDLTNLLLHFPDFLPSDFQPWIDPEAAKREGKTSQQMAADTAAMWSKGLSDWGITSEDVLELKNAVNFTVYTPGSTSGVPVNVMSSFTAPDIPWEENREMLRERIASNITALLGLIGYNDIDPLSSKEHILLSNIMEHFWSQGGSFDLTDLIMKTQDPPFDRLGAFPIERLFPEKERFVLAMKLNNFLASPSFQTWLQGQTLDIQQIYFSPDGKPRHSIFYLAHLSENERMFFVTLLFGAVESWMRRQSGTSGLRALIYFDEILGYLPPVANPPSHTIMLRMLKQARAFGVGLVLTSQNPVDLDYKALSNAGTWMIGRLQTDQDKERLMDGLQTASGSIDRNEANKLLSNLGKRIFLLHNIHEKGLTLFNTRWAMNYLAGPMARNQIPALNALVGAGKSAELPGQSKLYESETKKDQMQSDHIISKHPVLPSGIDEFYLPDNLSLEKAIEVHNLNISKNASIENLNYHPTLLVQCEIRFQNSKYDLQTITRKAALVEDEDGRLIRWDDFQCAPIDRQSLSQTALPQSTYGLLPGWLSDPKNLKSLEGDFVEWVYRNARFIVRANEALNLYGGPEISTVDFRKQCSDAARDQLNKDLDDLKSKINKKMDSLEDKLEKEERDVKSAETRLEQRRMEEVGTHGELLLSFISKRKKSISSSLTKRRMTTQAKSYLEEQKLDVEQVKRELDALEEEMKKAVADLENAWAEKVNDITEIPLSPFKKDIYSEIFGIAWLPYYIVKEGDQSHEIIAFNAEML